MAKVTVDHVSGVLYIVTCVQCASPASGCGVVDSTVQQCSTGLGCLEASIEAAVIRRHGGKSENK